MDHKPTFSAFSFLVYRFTLTPFSQMHMPILNKGSVLRGALGHALKKLVCTNQNITACPQCDMSTQCPYNMIFSPSNLIHFKRIRDIPRGFVIKPPLDVESSYDKERPFVFDLVIFGKHCATFPWFVVALSLLSNMGIGLNRARFNISDISIWNGDSFVPIYNPETRMIQNEQYFITAEKLMKSMEASSDTITLNFLTPTRIKYNLTGEKGKSTIVKRPEFHHLIRRLVQRLNILSTIYCDCKFVDEVDSLIDASMQIKTVSSDMVWHHRTRKSKTMKGKEGMPATHDQSGFTGSISFKGNLQDFIPLLLLGQYVHVGEDTVFGNGWYEVVTEKEAT